MTNKNLERWIIFQTKATTMKQNELKADIQAKHFYTGLNRPFALIRSRDSDTVDSKGVRRAKKTQQSVEKKKLTWKKSKW